MKSLKPFFKAILESFNPNAYQHLSARFWRDAFHYLLSVIFVCFLVVGVISLPAIGNIPNTLDEEFSKFTTLKLSGEVEMSAPIVFSDSGDPIIVIDKTGEFQNVTTETLLVTNDTVYYTPFFQTYERSIKDISDLVKNHDLFVLIVWTLIIMIMPMLLLLMVLGFFAKYMLIIGCTVLLAFIVTSIMKYDIKLRHLFKIGVYAATPMIILDIISVPFVSFWGIPYVLYGFYFTVGVALNAEKKIVHRG